MLISRLFILLALCLNVFGRSLSDSNTSFIVQLVRRKGKTGSSSSSSSSTSSGSSGTKTNCSNNEYHCSGTTCGYGNYYAPSAAAAAAGYGTARYHGNSTTSKTSGGSNLVSL